MNRRIFGLPRFPGSQRDVQAAINATQIEVNDNLTTTLKAVAERLDLHAERLGLLEDRLR